eukprot:6239616-Pyramimonas_sp.AAC.1
MPRTNSHTAHVSVAPPPSGSKRTSADVSPSISALNTDSCTPVRYAILCVCEHAYVGQHA